MATATKKPATRSTKSTTKAKASVTRTKATAARKKSPVKKAVHMRSFYPCDDPNEFMTTKPTVQSFYWLIIGVAVLVLISWTMYLTAQIQGIYDAIDASNATTYNLIEKK